MAKKVTKKREKKAEKATPRRVEKGNHFRNNYLETSVDRLLEMVKRRGRVKVSEAAKSFNVPESTVEEWGKVLEEYGFIKLHYPPIGKPVLKVLKNYVEKKPVIEKIK